MQTKSLIAYGGTSKWYLPRVTKPKVIRLNTSEVEAFEQILKLDPECNGRIMNDKKGNKAKKKALRDEALLGVPIEDWSD